MKRICSKYFNRLSMLHFNSWPVKKNSVFFLQKLSSTSYTKESILYSSSFDIHLFLHSTIYKTKLNPKPNWIQNQTEHKTKLNPKPNWTQNQTESKTKLTPKQNWIQNKTDPKTKLNPKPNWTQNKTDLKTKLNPKPNWTQNKTEPKTKQNWTQNKTEPKTKRLMFMRCCVVFVFVEFHTKHLR